MKNFDDMTSADFELSGRYLCGSMSYHDVKMLPMTLVGADDKELQGLVDKIIRDPLPQDYTPSMNRRIIGMARMNAF